MLVWRFALVMLAVAALPLVAAAQDRMVLAAGAISLERPAEPRFTDADGFDGLISPETGATMHGAILAEPARAVIDRLTNGAAPGQGSQITARRDTTFGRWPGQVIEMRQQEGDLAYLKTIAVFGDRSFTAVTVITYPATLERRLSDTFRRTIETVRALETYLSSDPLSNNYEVVPGQPLAQLPAEGTTRLFTQNGQPPVAVPGDAILAIEPRNYPNDTPPEDRVAFATGLLAEIAGVVEPEALVTEPTRIGGLPAVQIVGRALAAANRAQRLRLYQAVIFLDHGYFLHRGVVNIDLDGMFLPAFVNTSESFRRTVPIAAPAPTAG